ncbi:MAG: hypothetical protein A2158_00325 [Chloroflexi bacterium RBG_13_46_14]|nr:MAG: hypothetical protein A2158_00325 [Chloroflexi bacterium RBG_13_46_14]
MPLYVKYSHWTISKNKPLKYYILTITKKEMLTRIPACLGLYTIWVMLKYAVAIETLTKMEQMVIEKFISRITATMDIESIYLFGSRAEVEGHKESDIDVAIVVSNEAIKEITQRVIESSIEVEEDLDVSGTLMLSPIVINEMLLKSNIGIGKNIREKGILLWSKKSRQKRKVI